MPDPEQARIRKSRARKVSNRGSRAVPAAKADTHHHRSGGLSMVRLTQKGVAHATSVLCNTCGYRESDRRGLGAIMMRGWWAQSMTSGQRHLCGGCYRGLELLAREGYWRGQPKLAIDVGQA